MAILTGETSIEATAPAPPVIPTGIVNGMINGEAKVIQEKVMGMAKTDLFPAMMIIFVIITVETIITIEAIRTEGGGLHHLILGEIITMTDEAGEMEEENGVEDGRGALLLERMTIVGMERVFVAVVAGTPLVERMSENEISTDAMLVHHRHLYHNGEVEVHEEKFLKGRKIGVTPSRAGASLVRYRDLVATPPSQTGRDHAHEVTPLDHHTAELVPLDRYQGAIPVHRLNLLLIVSMAVALAITVMTKNEGRVGALLAPNHLTLPTSTKWQY